MTSEFWFDNWLVEGVEANADIEDLEMEALPRSRRVIPEVVPFLVPEAHNQQIVVIGERQVGLGSIAVSIFVQGFVEIDNHSVRSDPNIYLDTDTRCLGQVDQVSELSEKASVGSLPDFSSSSSSSGQALDDTIQVSLTLHLKEHFK